MGKISEGNDVGISEIFRAVAHQIRFLMRAYKHRNYFRKWRITGESAGRIVEIEHKKGEE